jgi:hypothetical protein
LEYRYSEPISNDNTAVPNLNYNGKSSEDGEHQQPEEGLKPSNYPKNPQVGENPSNSISDKNAGDTTNKRVTWAKELWAFKKVHISAAGKVALDSSGFVN